MLWMLRLQVHVQAMLVAGHIGAMPALLRGQVTALVAQVPGEILLVGVGLVAARTNMRTTRGRNIIQRGDRLYGYGPGVL